jgi:phosphatidylserine decarboxylase
MRLTPYGRDILTWSLLLGTGMIIAGILVEPQLVRWPLIVLGSALDLFALYFFRDPNRTLPADADASVVIAPADGKVILVKSLDETEYLNGPGTLVAIFLSPLDVHVNRIPVNGVVKMKEYHKGRYVPAFTEHSGEQNERMHIGIQADGFRVLMKQIAGTVARRIVCPLNIDQQVRMGERCGMIKYGSRTDLVLPPQFEPVVRVGDRVVGGETVLYRRTGSHN